MKVVCMKDKLLEGINVVQKAVSAKTTLQILEGILVEAGERFKLTGNDLEMGIEAFIDADIRVEGSIVINSKMFGSIVRQLPDSEVFIEVKDNSLVVIECENSRFEIKGLPPKGFPALPAVKNENVFEVAQKTIKDMIRQTAFAVSVDENRPTLTGALVECKEGELTFVAIDGFRLALRKSKVEQKDIELKAIVPGKTLNEIGKILTGQDKVSICIDKNQISFKFPTCKVVSRLLEGEYLNYRSIIPKDRETYIRLNTKELLSSIERASLICGMDDRKNPVVFNIQEQKLVITSNTETGAVREEVTIEMEGQQLEIGFNPRYFIDALKAVEDDIIDIHFTSNVGPCTIYPVDEEYYTYLILPVRPRG